jgi:hypothetical protein
MNNATCLNTCRWETKSSTLIHARDSSIVTWPDNLIREHPAIDDLTDTVLSALPKKFHA